MMYMKNVFFQLFAITLVASNRIIGNYFVYKKVPAVAGLSCGITKDDFKTIKMLSDVGILASVKGTLTKFDLSKFLNVNHKKLGVYVDLRCKGRNASDIFNHASYNRMYDYTYVWLILANDINYVLRSLNDTAFSVMTDFVISVPNHDHYDLYDVYNPCKIRGGVLNVTKYATWRENSGLNVIISETMIRRRWNYHGMKVNVSGFIQLPHEGVTVREYLESEENVQIDNWAKFGYSLIVTLTEMFNFTMHVTELTAWPKNDTNGPLMSALNKGTVDLGYYPSIVTRQRLNIANLLMKIWPVRTCFMFRTLPSTKIQVDMILHPLASESWYTIILFVFLSVIVFSLILKWQRKNCPDYGTALLTIIGTLCMQGTQVVPYEFASRIALFYIGIFGLLVNNYYSAAIVSARLNEPIDKMNDSLYSLVDSGLQLATQHTIVFEFMIETEENDMRYFKKRWEKIPKHKRYYDVEEGVRKMMSGGFAYHTDPHNAYPYIERYFDMSMTCQLNEIHFLRPTQVALWGSHDRYFSEIAKIGLLKMSSSGIRRRQIKRWKSQTPYCQQDRRLEASVTIYEAAPIIILLIFGVILSIIICLVENILFRILRTKQQLQQRKLITKLYNHKREKKTSLLLMRQ